MRLTIYHNPRCSNSRRCLEIIREAGFEPTIVEYLQSPLSQGELERLVGKVGGRVRDVIRAKEPVFAELGLDSDDDAALLQAVTAHPVLLNRPIVETETAAKLCRPPELVRELLA